MMGRLKGDQGQLFYEFPCSPTSGALGAQGQQSDGVKSITIDALTSASFPVLPDAAVAMSVHRGRPEVAWPGQNDANDPNRTLRAPRQELWYPPSNAMGRFNEAADPQMALVLSVLVSCDCTRI